MIKYKEDCLSISGQQSINLEKGTIEFKNYFKQLPVSFKISADFECNLKMLNVMKVLTQKNIMSMFLVIMLIKLFILMINLVSQLFFIEVKMLLMNLLNQ